MTDQAGRQAVGRSLARTSQLLEYCNTMI